MGASVTTEDLSVSCSLQQDNPSFSGGTVNKGGTVKAKWSWDTPPEPISESSITETVEADVVVIGMGNAGVHTALSCAENGLNVVCLEKSATVQARGGSTGSCESHLHREMDLHVNRDRAQYLWVRSSGNRCSESLVNLWFDRSGEALDWMWKNVQSVDPGAKQALISAWGKFEWFPEEPDNCSTQASPDFVVPDEVFSIEFAPGVKFFYMPTAAHFKILKERYRVPVHFETIAEQLIKDGDRVVGVIAKNKNGDYIRYNGSKGVVLCTGDIASDPEMMECFAEEFTANAIDNQFVPPGLNTGDGHKMAMWIGAAMQGKPFPPMLHPQALATFHGPFMSVNVRGKRFMNEGTWVQGKAVKYMQQPKHYVFTVFDNNFTRDTADSLQYGGGMFWDSLSGFEGVPFNEAAQRAEIEGYVKREVGFKADTLEALADQLDVDKRAFLEQVRKYNDDCAAGVDTQFRKDPRLMYPIVDPPFYAMKNGGTMMCMPGGVKMSERLECLDVDENVIPGLYAAGNASGDFYTQDYPIHVSGTSTSRCLTWGYLLGRYLAGVE
jgi:succinate dehydrogenase/fumarate reductase flavoprotein subunit